ncbi:MAG TPA: hypothetical protein VIT23_11170, partial [Terrimicrobiaceae bacterium]
GVFTWRGFVDIFDAAPGADLGSHLALLVIRSFFAYMDNPLLASFTMAMVESNERGSAAGVTHLARIAPFGISPTISTYLIQTVSLTLPCSSAAGYSCSMTWHSS